MNLLSDSLEVAILLEVPKLHKQSLDDLYEEFESIKEEVVELLTSKGDILMYGSKKKGEVANIFKEVAHGVALMAVIVPGGVEVFGQRFEHPHPELPEINET